MNGNADYHGCRLPRYFVTVDKKIVFDYPKDFDTTKKYGFNSYPWDTDTSELSNLIEEYIQRPQAELMEPFEQDQWGLTNLLRVCDRRIGKRRLHELLRITTDHTLREVIEKRMQKPKQ